MPISLASNGISIRPFDERDVAPFVVAVRESTETVGRWMPWARADYSENDAQAWFSECAVNIASNRSYDLGIFALDGRKFYGGVAINQINSAHNFGNIGYWVRQSCQRRGIAERALCLVIDFGFRELKLTRLEIIAGIENEASRRLAEKIGAHFECIARNRMFVSGEPRPAAVYSIVP
jgi:ribosomal-protein-serine acetyltransferase